jgi:hypothetical protein
MLLDMGIAHVFCPPLNARGEDWRVRLACLPGRGGWA